MKFFDIFIFIVVTICISIFGILKAKFNKPRKELESDRLLGSNVSIWPVALSVCSSFISAISLLGYPAEIYYRGAFIYWYSVMYAMAFPIIAYIFLPTFYDLKLPSLYEYLEKRFSFKCRILTSCIFLFQTILYSGVILYAPALALASALNISTILSIFITGLLSAMYLCVGGARAGIYTSAMQMFVVFVTLILIVIISFATWGFADIYETSRIGLRLKMDDFRIDPRLRHGFFPLMLGGCFNMFALYAANQSTMQRYLSMPNLKQAQKVLLLNIPMNICMITMYLILGTVMYFAFIDCHPNLPAKDQLLPHFLETKLGWIIGLEGIFLAAIYSSGLGVLTASYNALTAVTLEDIIKQIFRIENEKQKIMLERFYSTAITYLPLFFASLVALTAIAIQQLKSMILQIAFSIFGSAGGVILGVFCLGLFCPWIKSSKAVICGEISALIACLFLVIGTFVYQVQPINLPLEADCKTNALIPYRWDDNFNRVSSNADTLWSNYSQISYQYYALIGVAINFVVTNAIQIFINLLSGQNNSNRTDPRLICHVLRPYLRVHKEDEDNRHQVEVPLIENIVEKI